MLYFFLIMRVKIVTERQNMVNYTINIGTSDFRELATNNALFVDKTSLIQTVLTNGYKVTLITRPRRWGKTRNMTMLQYFFTIPVKGDGRIDEKEKSRRQKLFLSNENRTVPKYYKKIPWADSNHFYFFQKNKREELQGNRARYWRSYL